MEKRIDPLTELVFSETPVQIEQTRTKSWKQLDKTAVMNIYGATGTGLVEGFLEEEYNSKLAGSEGIKTFDRMRKSDAQVFATLLAMELPIRATKWSIQPAVNDEGETGDQEHEIADFVQKALFEKMEITFDDFLREALTMLPFGFSVFEKVWTSDWNNVWLKKLATRKQTSIYRWQQEDGTAGIQQILPQPAVEGVFAGSNFVSVPAEKLLIFSFRREGDNYAGTSVLRSAYKSFYIKDGLYKFDSVRHERQSVGIPVIYLPDNATPEDKAEAFQIVTNIRSTEQSGIVMPGPKSAGWEFEFADTKASQSTNLFESIKHHNREIAKNILAQFLELGDTKSASKSASGDQTDLFILSLGAIAKQIADTINRFLIPELVNMNFDGVDNYPRIKFEKLGSVDYEKFATILSTLSTATILKPDEDLEDYIREMLDLPARMEQEDGAADIESDAEGEEPGDEEPAVGSVVGQNQDPGAADPSTTDASNQAELDGLQSELDALQASEEADEADLAMFTDLLLSEMEFACDEYEEQASAFIAQGGTMDDATKQKISEALKKKYGTLNNAKTAATKKIADHSAEITAAQEKFKADTASMRSEISNLQAIHDKIKTGKATVKERKALAAKTSELNKKIREMRRGRDATIAPIQAIKTADMKSKAAVTAVLKERKAAVMEKIKGIRQQITDGKVSLQEGTKPLKADISANTDQMKSLRSAMSSMPKGEQKDAVKAMIEGLRAENDQNRTAVKGMTSDFQTTASGKKNEIATAKADLAKLHEHSESCGCSDDLKNTYFDENFIAISQKFNNKFIIELQNECRSADDYARLKAKGFKFNEYEGDSPRPLTFAERKVNFTSLKRSMATFEQVLKDKIDEITAKQKADILSQIKKAVDGNDIAAVGEIKAKYTGDLSQALTDVQKEMFEIGKKSAAVEMNVQVPPTKAEVRGAMRVQNDAMIESMVTDMETTAKTAVTQVAHKKGGSITNTNASEAIAAASSAIDKVITGQKNTLNTLGVTGSVNLGRSSIFERYPEKIYAFQYSAILDARTTEMCRSLDGRVVKAGSAEFYDYAPPRHYNCRSIWVEILQEETFKPDISGIPSSIPANATIDTFKDLKAPIILKGSPAIKVIQQELADTKQKLADLPEGKYANRAEGYKNRIKELETSLEGTFSEYCREILKADGIHFKE